MPVTRKGDHKRGLSVRQYIDPLPYPAPKEVTGTRTDRHFGRRNQRPTRWRGPQQAKSEPVIPLEADVPRTSVELSKRDPPRARNRNRTMKSSTKSQCVELRFSFTAISDETLRAPHQDQSFNQSFSGLSMTADAGWPSFGVQSNTKSDRSRREAVLGVPELSKPRKKREGYGFSYSETFWQDSDEYPDTECEWEPEEQTTQPRPADLRSSSQRQAWEETHRMTRSFTNESTTTIEDHSFNDLVVLRDVGSYHIARPQRILPCTCATREDTITLKTQAKALFSRYQESIDVQAQLLTRLERMVYSEQQKTQFEDQPTAASIEHCARKLREFLLAIQNGRIDTGEHRRFVEHEIEWVNWLVDASRTGVMHIRTDGCNCRPDWEEE